MTICVIERLSLWTWNRSIWPRLRRAGGISVSQPVCRCYVVEGSPWAVRIARWMGRRRGISVEPLAWRLIDVKDTQGLLVRLRIAYQDAAAWQAGVLQRSDVQAWLQQPVLPDTLRVFLAKQLATLGFGQPGTPGRALLLMQLCIWKAGGQGKACGVVFLEARPWREAYESYAASYGLAVRMTPARTAWRAGALAQRALGLRKIAWLRMVRNRLVLWWRNPFGRRPMSGPPSRSSGTAARLAVDYYGHLDLDMAERYSDLFFWQQGGLRGSDFLVTFRIPRDPLDACKAKELAAHGMSAIALEPSATSLPDAVVWTGRRSGCAKTIRHRPWRLDRREARWWRDQLEQFDVDAGWWEALFAAWHVKLYVSWFKYDASHCVIAEALRRLGGVLAIYQRAYESHPSVETTIAADVVFGFSPAVAETERRGGSRIAYHVATGYLGDHRFSLLRPQAQQVRAALAKAGARRVIAFSDENSHDDERWAMGHTVMRESYAFLLDKVLNEAWVGLVLKPKMPSTLRRRLGPVAPLLAAAQATGRCVLYEEGTLHGAYPPAAAALAADVMVHGHLCASTAGLESALAGVPTLLMDREGWPISPLYRLGEGRVVFREWPALWTACVEVWDSPVPPDGFGDWSPLLEELDPFRDGRAAARMGAFLGWLLEDLSAGRRREQALADAAERYAARWGQRYVTALNGASLRAVEEAALSPAGLT